MGTFGERLQRERELRGITLEEIAEATKIGTRSLRALEAEDFGLLPGGIFNKGFVRAYARYLGIDEEQAVTDYLAAVRAQAATVSPPAANQVPAPGSSSAPAPPQASAATPVPGQPRLAVALAAGAVLLALASFTLWKFYPSETADAAQDSAPAAVILPMREEEPEEPPLAAPPEERSIPEARLIPAAAEGEFVLQVRARERAWVSLVADGRTVYEGELDSADTRIVRAREMVVFKTGNAGGVELSHNGSVLGDIGAPGQVRTLTVTAEGVRR